MQKKYASLAFILSVFLAACAIPADKPDSSRKSPSKKSQPVATTNNKATNQNQLIQTRIQHSGKSEAFTNLDSATRNRVYQGQIQIGDPSWLVEVALGRPYYQTNHYANQPGLEEVWLYTKKQESTKVSQMDATHPEQDWPVTKKVTVNKVCETSERYVRFRYQKVIEISPANPPMPIGTCSERIVEEYIPKARR